MNLVDGTRDMQGAKMTVRAKTRRALRPRTQARTGTFAERAPRMADKRYGMTA